jgi:hypothetical protein
LTAAPQCNSKVVLHQDEIEERVKTVGSVAEASGMAARLDKNTILIPEAGWRFLHTAVLRAGRVA